MESVRVHCSRVNKPCNLPVSCYSRPCEDEHAAGFFIITMYYTSDLQFHYELLELIARRIRPSLYVGLGIAAGNCIKRVAPYCNRAIGVDISMAGISKDYEFFRGTTLEFAARVLPDLPPIEMAFIDADHKHESSLQDFELLLPHMAENGLILLHDTYPESASWTTNQLCSDTYKTAEVIRHYATAVYGVEIVTLPTPPGMSIVRKLSKHLHWTQ